MGRRCIATTLMGVMVILLLSLPAGAAMHRHRLAGGETLENLAKRYYGSSWKHVYLQQHNRLQGTPAVGASIMIPESWSYRVRTGDTVARIARRYLSSSDRYAVLAQMNGLQRPEDLVRGQELLMPFHLVHKAISGDTLTRIARRYYRTGRRAELLRSYNGMESTDLDVGKKIIIPIFDRATVAVASRAPSPQPPKPAARPSAAKQGKAPVEDLDVRGILKRARKIFKTGAYREARDVLIELVAAGGTEEPAVFRILGICAVAIGDSAEAAGYFSRWLEMEPEATLDPIRTSPKILRVFHAVRSESR